MKKYLIRFGRLMLAIPLFFLFTACTDTAPRGGGDILVLGDSVMAWNSSSGTAIPDVIGATLGRSVFSKAVPGAQFDNTSTLAGAVGFDIQRQLPSGRWNWVVMNGGANDLSADCGCGACGASVNALISADARSGSIPNFIRKVQNQSGANVMWMGYYAGSGTGPFAGCRDDLVELEARIAKFAATDDAVFFVDAEDVIDRTKRGLFATDNIHPSASGSAIIGAHLAKTINGVDPRSQISR